MPVTSVKRLAAGAWSHGQRLARGCADLKRSWVEVEVSWARSPAAGLVREFFLTGVLGPAMDFYTRRRVMGSERLAALEGPVIFVANHSSHLDTPVILRALPREWRRRTVVAAAADYFFEKRLLGHAVALAFSAVPMRRHGGGLDPGAASQVIELVRNRWSLVIYAEGTRSRDGAVGRLRSGAAVLAADEGLPIVPVYVSGTHDAMPPGRWWASRKPGRPFSTRHPLDVRFGPPVRPREGERPSAVMERVRLFFAESGAVTRKRARPVEDRSGQAGTQPAQLA